MAPTATGGALGAAVSSARRVWTDRSVRRIQGREHIVAASHLQLVALVMLSVMKIKPINDWHSIEEQTIDTS